MCNEVLLNVRVNDIHPEHIKRFSFPRGAHKRISLPFSTTLDSEHKRQSQ